MGEKEDAIIEQLMADMKQLRIEKDHLEQKTRRNWVSKEMIGIYSAVLAGMGAWGNTYLDNMQQQQKQEKVVETSRNVDRALTQYVDQQMEGVYETCTLYLDGILSALPGHQRRKVERFLEAEGDLDPEPIPEPAPAPAVRVPRPKKPTILEEMVVDSPPPTAAAAPLKKDAYQQILQAAEKPELLEAQLNEIINEKNRQRKAPKTK